MIDTWLRVKVVIVDQSDTARNLRLCFSSRMSSDGTIPEMQYLVKKRKEKKDYYNNWKGVHPKAISDDFTFNFCVA